MRAIGEPNIFSLIGRLRELRRIWMCGSCSRDYLGIRGFDMQM
jgi:hypothetical protein